MRAVRPIIFSAPMVRALLEGRKTQTRRLATSPLRHCAPGDLLYVREAHFVQCAGYKDGSGKLILYRADTPDAPTTWTPSIHMPRFASRLTLEVTVVRAQKLHWITVADVKAEGFEKPSAMMTLWDELHGDGSWDANPEVVALTFRVIKANVDQLQGQLANG